MLFDDESSRIVSPAILYDLYLSVLPALGAALARHIVVNGADGIASGVEANRQRSTATSSGIALADAFGQLNEIGYRWVDFHRFVVEHVAVEISGHDIDAFVVTTINLSVPSFDLDGWAVDAVACQNHLGQLREYDNVFVVTEADA